MQGADDACQHAARRIQDLEGEIRDLRARHAEQLTQLQHQQARSAHSLVPVSMERFSHAYTLD